MLALFLRKSGQQQGPVAQWSEQGTHNPLVVGSIPTGPTMKNILKSLLMKNIVDGFQDMKEISMEDAMRFYEEENIAEVIWTIR